MRRMQIMMVARYEALVLSRNVLFRLLVLFGIVGVFLLQYLVQGDNPYSWSMVAYSSSMPLVNAYLYNWVQCFLVVFFAAELPSRERGGGSLDVVHARPEGNGDYFWGKMLGILAVFAGVNAVEALACMFANALMADIPFNPGIYFFYFLTLTFPSLVFMLGFSVFVAFVSSSRALSLLLSLSLLFLGGGALQSVCRGSADFLGITQARVFSDVTGFPDLGLYLAQRGGVLLTGLGLLFFSASCLGRLPSVAGGNRALLARGAVLVAFGVACVSGYVLAHVREDRVREDYRASFSRHWRQRTCRVSAHELRLRQEGSRLDLRSRMTVRNPNGEELPRLTLYLNPGLEVEEVLVDGEPAGFERDNQVLEIGRALSAGDSVEVELAYGGEIDERYCFLDMTDGEYHDASRGDAFFRFGRRYALVDEDCLLLTPETGWYPVAIPTSNPDAPLLAYGDFTRFRLRVEAPKQKVVLSQGIARRRGDTLTFENPLAVEGLSVCGGDYRHYRMALKGLNLDFYYFPGHDVVSSAFEVLEEEDVWASVQKHLCTEDDNSMTIRLDSFEQCYGGFPWYDYPGGKTLRLVESPSSFSSCYRLSQGKSEYVQPGLVFWDELGGDIFVGNANFLRGKIRYSDRESRRLTEDGFIYGIVSENLSASSKTMKQDNPFLDKLGLRRNEVADRFNLYDASELLAGRQTRIYSEEFPELDGMLRHLNEVEMTYTFGYESYSEKQQFIQAALLQYGLDSFVYLKGVPGEVLDDLERLARHYLVNRLALDFSREKLLGWFDDACARYRGREMPFAVLDEEYERQFGKSLGAIIRSWRSWQPTTFSIKDLNGIDDVKGEAWRSRIRFEVMNTGRDTGLISVLYNTFDENGDFLTQQRNFLMPPGEAWEVKVVGGQINHFVVDLGLTRNLPYLLAAPRRNFSYFMFDERVADTADGAFPISPSVFLADTTELVVDNRDKGFSLQEPKLTLVERIQTRLNAEVYTPYVYNYNVTRWTRFVGSTLCGDSIRDAYYKLYGEGKHKAEWRVDIPQEGMYEVFALLHTSTVYHYTVYHGAEENEVVLNEKVDDDDLDVATQGWCSLGRYYFPKGEARVVLDDSKANDEMYEGSDNVIIADAVKWVKVE